MPAEAALPILAGLWTHDEDVGDPHIPLLTWWALEAHAETDRAAVLKLLADKPLWGRPVVDQFILDRLMQRWTMAGGRDNLVACAKLLKTAPGKKQVNRLLAGLEKGFAGRSSGEIPHELREAVVAAWSGGAGATSVTLGLRIGHGPALEKALALIADEKAGRAQRLECIRILGEIDQPQSVPVMLKVLRDSPSGVVRQEVLAALQRHPDAKIAETVLELYPAKLPEKDGVRGAAHNLLASRPGWALAFLKQIDVGKINPRSIPQEVVQKLQLHRDKEVARLVGKHCGRVRGSASQFKDREILRLGKAMKTGKGNALAGKTVFKNTCAKCHKLFGEGGEVGPDLTGYERTNAMYWMENIVDPSAVIREEYVTFIIQTTDGRTLQGIVAGQDKTTVTLRDPENRTMRIARTKIEDMRASPISLMPEGQMKALSDQQVRDLFAYLMSKGPVK